MKIKFVVIGGWVRDFGTNDIYVSPARLVRLYRVDPYRCIMADSYDSEVLRGLNPSEYIVLHPDSTGEYKVKVENSNTQEYL